MLSCGLNHSDMFRDLVKSSVPSFMHKKNFSEKLYSVIASGCKRYKDILT